MTRLIRSWYPSTTDGQCNGHLETCRCAAQADPLPHAQPSAPLHPEQSVVRTLPERSFQQLSSFAARNNH